MRDRPLVWLSETVRSPPFSHEARKRAGLLLRKLQRGESIPMPDSRPMPSIGPRCHELRIADRQAGKSWRIIYRVDLDAVIVVDAFAKKTRGTPVAAIRRASHRLQHYDHIA